MVQHVNSLCISCMLRMIGELKAPSQGVKHGSCLFVTQSNKSKYDKVDKIKNSKTPVIKFINNLFLTRLYINEILT